MPDNEHLYERNGIWWMRAAIKRIEYRESLRTKDVKVARRRRDQRIAEIAGARQFGERKTPWKEAVVAWADYTMGQIAPTTAKRYAVSLKQCEPWLGNAEIAAIDGKLIWRMVEARRRAGATPATVRRDLTAVSRVMEYAEAQGWREGNPTLSKRRLLRERRDPIALPARDDIEFVLSVCSPAFASFVKAAWLTGCRQDELVTAKWRGFDEPANTLEVIGKGSKRRVIALSEKARSLILVQAKCLVDYRSDALIFPAASGDAFSQAASDFTHFRRAAIAKAAREGRAFRPFRFHDLRHLFAVEELRRGRGLYNLSKHLGHTSVKTTEWYLAFLTTEQAEAAKAETAQTRHNPQRSERG